ncbi:DNA cytosine methyltransferase [Xanthocytophaga agilis]|uniref:DNA (cytosine-5-)-methyltransferase n=1 Tax=Xanthocytophaga agilis TaxID=3048010 RepID=A0AAE3QYL0_9BACT|nr:DNA cytosine methyltransferase [Xanthocytophaga agilis]MDJ1500486.1 DNA cytosine methyltransferase [Xanthocytophaga agilis]
MNSNQITLTDMFCGCGGSSQGAKKVAGVEVKYALNHWKLAIESHNTNHPDTHHDCADISETHPARYNRTTGLIASPECTKHSGGSGKKRKNLNQQDIFQNKAFDPSAIKSRATMWDVPRFAEIHNYEFIITENVVEVRDWIMWDAWLKAMHLLGYQHECVYLNAQFAHGEGISGFSPQSRDRIYVVFWKKGNKKPNLQIRPKAPCIRCGEVEAYQAWKPKSPKYGKYKKQYIYQCSICNTEVVPYYYAALNAVDFTIPMVRIADRHKLKMKDLCDNTIARIKYGLQKYSKPTTEVNNSYLFEPFVLETAYTHSKSDRTRSLMNVLMTQTTQQSLGMVTPFFGIHHGNSKVHSAEDPLSTVTTGGIHSSIILAPYHGKKQASLVLDPTSTIPTKDSISLIETAPKIEDCYFRMLQPSETAKAQGFPSDYVILGSKKLQQRQIGNANPPPTMELLVSRCVASLT